MVFLLFFKQKTAYEMRISDWSSDVCSSDLARPRRFHRQMDRAGGPRPAAHRRHRRRTRDARRGGAGDRAGIARGAGGTGQDRRPGYPRSRADRKSVVSGKSVSVRVALGGRRIMKKKNYDVNI